MKKIIIVDDNSLSVEGLYKNIDWESLGVEVSDLFYDGERVLSSLENQSVDIVISDIKMPGMDGISLSKAILERNNKTKIILISAYDDFEYAKQAVRLGAFDYVEKPIDYEYLSRIIKKAVGEIAREEKNFEELQRSRPIIIDNFFKELIHMPMDESKYMFKEYPGYLDINLDLKFYNCAVLEFDDIAKSKEKLGVENYLLTLIQIKEEIGILLSDLSILKVITDMNKIIVISGYTCGSETIFLQKIYDAMNYIVEEYYSSDLIFNIGIGGITGSLWNIRSSYKSATAALDYRFFFPQKNIFDIRDVSDL